MENKQIAERFYSFANLMEIRGEDAFRVRSYRNAAEVIETWTKPLRIMAAEEGAKGLTSIPGIGRAISAKILDLLETGTFEAWEKLTAETPETVLELLSLNGVGIKTATTLHTKFKINSLADLRLFVEGGGLEMVDGIGDKGALRIKQSLQQ